jgi:biopolymer transport protein ExbB
MELLKRYFLVPVVVASVAVSWFLWARSPEYIRQAGPLLVLGLTCLFLVLTFCVERLVVLWRAGGRGSVPSFVRNLREALRGGEIAAAIEACKRQGGSLGNVVGAGLQRYHKLTGQGRGRDEVLAETRRALVEASSFETPHLERNLSALSTLASSATLIGLLGTTIGMIRSFRAMSRAGAPDATQLALGISEALVNTALGLVTAILGTWLFNYFSTRVDRFNGRMEETAYEVLQTLEDESA